MPLNFVVRHPFLAPSLLSLPLMGASDILAQHLEGSLLDRHRLTAVSSLGPFFNGGITVLFYRWLDQVCGSDPSMRTAFRKMALTQAIYMPLSLPVFLYLSVYLRDALQSFPSFPEGSHEYACQNVRDKIYDTFKASFFIWPASDMLNFTVVGLLTRHCRFNGFLPTSERAGTPS